MRQTVRVHSTLTKEEHEKAKKLSKKIFGKENVSGYLAHLIRNQKETTDEQSR